MKKKRKKDQLFPCLISSCLYPEILLLWYLLLSLSSLSLGSRSWSAQHSPGAPAATTPSTRASRGLGAAAAPSSPRRLSAAPPLLPPPAPYACSASSVRRGWRRRPPAALLSRSRVSGAQQRRRERTAQGRKEWISFLGCRFFRVLYTPAEPPLAIRSDRRPGLRRGEQLPRACRFTGPGPGCGLASGARHRGLPTVGWAIFGRSSKTVKYSDSHVQ